MACESCYDWTRTITAVQVKMPVSLAEQKFPNYHINCRSSQRSDYDGEFIIAGFCAGLIQQIFHYGAGRHIFEFEVDFH
mgnify:CR=1 FL=1